MKCSECGADIFEGISRCPFCKTPTTTINDEKFKNFDFTYTITSKEQIKAIRDTVTQVSDEKSKSPLSKLSFSSKSHKKRSGSERPQRDRKINRKKIMGIATLCLAFLCLVAVLWGIIALIGSVTGNHEVVSAYTYTKDNSMYLVYQNNTAKLSHTAISEDYLRRADADTALASGTEVLRSVDLAHNSKNGQFTYFLDGYDPETSSGTLKLIKKGKEKTITTITDAVHNSVVISSDGKSVLFLQSADENGDMGVLYYWNTGLESPHKISTDIDHGTFVFSADNDEALFLQNLDRTVMHGDLYSQNLNKLKKEKIKIDGEVCRIFGTDHKGDNYIYAKAFDTANKSFEIYTCSNEPESEKIRLGERTLLAPHMLTSRNYMLVYGLNDDGTNNLYHVNIKNGNKEKIASGVNRIQKISDDEKHILYDKVYNGTTADYYIYTSGKQPQKVAGNVTVIPDDANSTPQLAASHDLKTVVYISGFDSRTGSGKLYISKFKPGKVSEPEHISDDVHSCHMTTNGSILYTKDYSLTRKVFDIYIYDKESPRMLKDELSPEMFEVSKTGDNIFYISGFNATTNSGELMVSNLDGKSEALAEGVFGFDQTKHGDILFYKNLDTENGKFDLYIARNGKTKTVHIDSKTDGLMP